MIVFKRWHRWDRYKRNILGVYEGWFLFGFIPIYVRSYQSDIAQ